MRKFLLLAVPLFVAGSFSVAQGARHSSFTKTAVCNLTSSTTQPYQRVVATTAAALKAYTAKPDNIVPAPKSCPKTLLTSSTGGVEIGSELVGVTEQPAPGDPDGTGVATLRLRQGQGRVCFVLSVQNLGTPTAAHIHKGTVDDSGPVVVPLGTPNSSGAANGCAVASRTVVSDILKNGSGYYVNVHSSDFPNGAIRAQLQPPQAFLLQATMTGANERPSTGDTDGSGLGEFLLRPDKGQLCYTLASTNVLMPATGAHIHRGDGTVAGPVIIPFTPPTATGSSEGCVTVDAGLLKEIIGNPGGFYANIHSTEFPGGAVRAPLVVLR